MYDMDFVDYSSRPLSPCRPQRSATPALIQVYASASPSQASPFQEADRILNCDYDIADGKARE